MRRGGPTGPPRLFGWTRNRRNPARKARCAKFSAAGQSKRAHCALISIKCIETSHFGAFFYGKRGVLGSAQTRQGLALDPAGALPLHPTRCRSQTFPKKLDNHNKEEQT